MKSSAQVVIIGGGSLGVSLLYHLAEEGWNDVILIEKGELTSGSTWHAAGLCSNFIGNMTVAKIHNYSIRLYDEILPSQSGNPSVFHKCGSLRVGYSRIEEEWFRHLLSRSKNVPCEFNIISKDEAKNLHPFMNFENARIIVNTPNDGHVDPSSVVMTMSQIATSKGAKINRFTRVKDIKKTQDGEWEVITEKGSIIAEHVVNAAGCFAPEVGAMINAKIPITNLEHQYLITEDHQELKNLKTELPVVRDSYCSSYLRQEGQGLLIGPYETFGAKPWALDGMDWDFDRGLFPDDLERLMPFLDRCMERMPIFSEVGIKTVINGAITHTPDDNVLVGPQFGHRNFWNLCGSSIGIAQGGIGKYLAQWMVHGQTELNMASLDSRRFGDWADKEYCVTKAIESYEIMYTEVGANENRHHGRARRVSPLYSLLNEKGAIHNVVAGFEKPLWFKTEKIKSEDLTWTRTNAHLAVADECKSVQNDVGVIDISGSSKFMVSGKDANKFLNFLSCNKLPQTIGAIGLTLFHGRSGGIMTEQSITKINDDTYYLVGPILSENRDLDWMKSHAKNFKVTIENQTETTSSLLITGPKSRELLQKIMKDDLSNSSLPWLRSKKMLVDSAQVRVMRVSYAGELGFELHMPSYQLLSIYQSLFRVGKEMGLRDFGGYAFNSLRMEKMYRGWGSEFTEEISGIEAGMERFIDINREFIGSDNLKKRMKKDLDVVLVYLVFDDDIQSECYGNEAVFHGEDLIGLTTSGAYGFRIKKSLAFAYIKPAFANEGQALKVLTTAGTRLCHIEISAAYDPENEKLRA